MKITIDINEELLKKAMELFPDKTISEIVNMALEFLVKTHKPNNIKKEK
jgi:Arc/MetJ family transcription regulator